MKRLEAAGVERKVAEAHAEAINVTVLPRLVTKDDLDNAVTRMESRMESLMWKHSLATMFGVLTIGSFLLRFMK